MEFGLALSTKLIELVGADRGQQPLLQRRGELQRQAQARVSRGKRHDLGPDVPLHAELAEQVEVVSPRLPVSAASEKRRLDQRDQPLKGGCWRIEVPGVPVGILEHDRAARARQPHVRLHLLVGASQGADHGAGVDEVERIRFELGGKEIVIREADVPQPFIGHEPIRRGQHRLVDVGPNHLPVGSHPLAQHPQPPERATANIQGARAPAVTDLLEQPPGARFPDQRLEVESFEL